MTEIVCLRCNTQSPENALYCQQCGQPLRCKDCRAELLPNARACIQCGHLIPERASSEQIPVGMHVVPPGYNHLKLHETPEERDLDLTVSNEAIAQIGDFLPSLLGTRLKSHNGSLVDNQSQKQASVVEVASDIPSPQPQLPAASSQPSLPKNSPEELIWEIFRKEDGGVLKLDITNLKASGKWDHILRLVHLYLYAKMQCNEDKILRTEVYAFLDNLGLKDKNNTSRNINQAQDIISNEDGTLRLAYEGRKQAEKYIAEVFNDELTSSWPTSSDSRPSANRTKKPSKKSGGQHSSPDVSVAGWISHPVTKDLAEAIDHSAIVSLSLVDKALLALYSIYKTSYEQEVSFASIITYLYNVFEVTVQPHALSNTLHRLREEKSIRSSYINYRPRQGYKSTPSGRKYIEDTLQLKLPQLTTIDENVGSNGAVQQ